MSHGLLSGLVAAALLIAATLLHPAFAWLVGAPLLVGATRRLASRREELVARVACGIVVATAFAVVVHAPWLTAAAQRYFALAPSTALAGALALAVGCGVVFGALLGVLLHGVAAVPPRWSAPALGAAWVTWEELTRIGFPSYPWVALAATQAGSPAVLQTAGLAGQAGLAFVLATCGAGVGRAARDGFRGATWPTLAWVALLVAAVATGGALRLRAVDAADGARHLGCALAAVDARIPHGELALGAALDRWITATEGALALAPDVVVWPESSLPRDPRLDEGALSRLRALARSQDVVLIVGAPRSAWDAGWRELAYNSLFVVAPSGRVETYDKRAPVAIGEVWPAPWMAPPRALAVAEVLPGAAPLLVEAAGCSVGTLVCSEAEHPALARELALGGADAIVVASNDAPLPQRAVAMEVAQARLRAVETGLPVLRAANRGASLAIDRYGRTLARGDGVVELRVVSRTEPAPATRWARPFLALCALATALTATAGLACRARR